jgi:hypothetical protein
MGLKMSNQAVIAPDVQARTPRQVRRLTVGLILVLIVQFLVGMLVNLFVTIPDSHPGSQPSEYFAGSFQSVAWALTQGPSLLAAHASFGLVLVLGSLALVFRARQLRRRRMTVAAVLGFLFIIGAGFNGASFLDFNEDFSSMIMATLFAAALLCYVGILSWLAEP